MSSRWSVALKMAFALFLAGVFIYFLQPRSAKEPEALPSLSSGEAFNGARHIAGIPCSSSTPKLASATQPIEATVPPFLAKYQFGTRWGHEEDTRFALFSAWADKYSAATPGERPALEAEGIALAKNRRDAMKALIQSQPKAALANTVPAAVRAEMPSGVVAQLEERISAKGDYLVLGRTDATGVPSVARRAVISGQSFEAYVYGDRVSQRTLKDISLHGVALDGQLALSDSPLRAIEPGEPVPDKPLAAESCIVSKQPAAPTKDGKRKGAIAAETGDKILWLCHGSHIVAAAEAIAESEGSAPQTANSGFQPNASTGQRSILVMMVDFPNIPGQTVVLDDAKTNLANVATFLHEASYGDLTIKTQVFTPVLRMPQSSTSYRDSSIGDTTLLNDARAAARAAGYDPSQYDFDIVGFTDIGFPWSGQGYVGFAGAWVQGTSFTPGTTAHELGHNMGVWHANSWDGNTSPTDPNGVHTEYGNVFDVMGSTPSFPKNHYNANFKHLFGWLPNQYLHIVTNSGTFRIYAQDQNSRLSGRHYGIRIPVGLIAAAEVEDYWIEYRQNFSYLPFVQSGAIVEWGNELGTASASRLLDSTPDTSTAYDSPVVVGSSLADDDNGITIATLAQGGSGAEAYLDIQITLNKQAISLADALDQPDWTFTTSDEGWVGEHSVTYDGLDAAASGVTANNGTNYVETIVTGPGAINFYWKVSSEPTFDFLRLRVDGVEVASISGEVDWQSRSYEIASGAHTVRWSYEKDQATIGGSDRAWLDKVSFTTGDRVPTINVQPAPVVAGIGENALFFVEAGGTAPLRYQWRVFKEGALMDIPGATNSAILLTNVQPSDGGTYSVAISNALGEIDSNDALLTVVRTIALTEALDSPGTVWTTDGALPWRGQNETTHDGVDAASSGPITDGKESILQTVVTGPGVASFWWKVSSEPDFDFLNFYMDGDLVEAHSGEFDWSAKSLQIPNGAHTLRWTYKKDASQSGGNDAAWVDQFQFVLTPNVPPSVLAQPATQSVSLGGTAQFTVGYVGSEPLRFQWFKDTTPLASRPGVTGVNSATLTITGVQSSDAGNYSVTITNDFGGAASASAPLNIVALSLGDALDQPRLAWRTGGDAPWKAQAASTHDGIDAAVSGLITDKQSTWIETHVPGPAIIAFFWKVSSEERFDLLTFEVDGVTAASISGTVDWTAQQSTIPAGDHVLRWKYTKDGNTSRGSDSGWVDQVAIATLPGAASPHISIAGKDAAGLNLTVDQLPTSGVFMVEASTNLTAWTTISTNNITATNMNIHRVLTNSAEFLRIRLP